MISNCTIRITHKSIRCDGYTSYQHTSIKGADGKPLKYTYHEAVDEARRLLHENHAQYALNDKEYVVEYQIFEGNQYVRTVRI